MASPFALTLDKAAAQASPYFYQWDSRNAPYSDVVVHKQMGNTRLYFHAADDTGALVKINAHEGLLATIGKAVHR